MKAQWQLIDLESRKSLATLGEPFNVSELFRDEWERQYHGTGKGTPVGILNCDNLKKDTP